MALARRIRPVTLWPTLTSDDRCGLDARLGAVRYSRSCCPPPPPPPQPTSSCTCSVDPVPVRSRYQPVRLCLRSPTPSLEAVRKLGSPPPLLLDLVFVLGRKQPVPSPLWLPVPVGPAMQKLPVAIWMPPLSRVRRPCQIEGFAIDMPQAPH